VQPQSSVSINVSLKDENVCRQDQPLQARGAPVREDGAKRQFHRGPCTRFHHREIYSQALAWTVSDLMENTDG
jgi:hypothetical protein